MKIMLDSGAYTIHRKGIKIDIDQYAEFVKKHSDLFHCFFNMDAIGDGKKSFDNWMYLRKKGIETIPIFHIGTSERFLKLYLKETDYIGLGAIANLNTKKRTKSLDYVFEKYFINKDGSAKCKVHGLGLTALPLMKRYPWWSVDSFTPIISAAWGGVMLPVFRDGDPVYENTLICKISDQATHKSGVQTSWSNLPFRFKKKCEELMKQKGFSIGEVHYQKRRARRGKQLVEMNNKFFDLTNESDDKQTLAGDWVARARWNLKVWEEVVKTFKYDKFKLNGDTLKSKTNIFVGVSTDSILEILKDNGVFDILVSFAYYNNENKIKSLRDISI